jgi:hypothetical protein
MFLGWLIAAFTPIALSFVGTCLALLITHYFGPYATERAKQKAATVHFETAVAELRRTTAEVERIKASISDELWVKQRWWDQKRDTYRALLLAATRLKHLMQDFATAVDNPVALASMEHEIKDMRVKLDDFLLELSTASLFISNLQAHEVISELLLRKIPPLVDAAGFSEMSNRFGRFEGDLAIAAKADLEMWCVDFPKPTPAAR